MFVSLLWPLHIPSFLNLCVSYYPKRTVLASLPALNHHHHHHHHRHNHHSRVLTTISITILQQLQSQWLILLEILLDDFTYDTFQPPHGQ